MPPVEVDRLAVEQLAYHVHEFTGPDVPLPLGKAVSVRALLDRVPAGDQVQGDAVAERIERVRAKAEGLGRKLRFGLRLHVITRDTAAEAWSEADRILAGFDPEAVRASQERFARMDSTGQARMTVLHGGSAENLTVAPNLWAGIGLVREGAGTALVGSHDEVAQRLFEYWQLGIDEFILSGYPHLEEAYRVGEEVAPRLRSLVEAAG